MSVGLTCGVNFAFATWNPFTGTVDEARAGTAVHEPLSAQDIRDLTASSRFGELVVGDAWSVGLHLSVWYVSDRLVATLDGDARLFPRSTAPALAESLERLLVEAACCDDETADLLSAAEVPAFPHRPGLVVIDGCPVDLAAVRDLVRDAVGPLPSGVFLTDDADTPRIEAYVVARDDMTSRSLHRTCLAELPGRRLVMTPHRYVVVAHAPADTESRSAWRAVPVVAAGTGREARQQTP